MRHATLLLLSACTGAIPIPEEEKYTPHTYDTSWGGGDAGGDGTVDSRDSAPDSDPPPDTDPPDSADPSLSDQDGDGLTDAFEGYSAESESRDWDGDGTPDYLDTDSDNDGVTDAIEGKADDGSPGPIDTDSDGNPDQIDLDSDGDGLADLVEGPPLHSDGSPEDTDSDGIPDLRDTDTDADGMADELEGTEDWDGDGIENWRDTLNDGPMPSLSFVRISTTFNQPIGIDFHESSGTVVMSVNYPTGNPVTLEKVAADGSHASFSSLSGLTDEVKIATVRADNPGGFGVGELYVGNGVEGQIVKISADGSTITNPWVSLPGANNGLMRGSLYVDRTGVWGGDLLVVTTTGEVWRVDAAGTPSHVATVAGTHLEGLITVPDAPDRYGPLAGCAIAGAESEGLLYAFDTTGAYTTHPLGVAIEDIELINPNENFFGVNYGTSYLVGVDAAEWLPIAGDILLTMESVSRVGLYRLYWDGVRLKVAELTAASGSASLGQWEHVTFARAGIQEIPVLPGLP